jgi:hypothetical protein
LALACAGQAWAQGEPARRAPARAIPGMLVEAGGGWRLNFEAGSDQLTPLQRLGLMRLGAALAQGAPGRVTIWAEVASGYDISATRRLALERGLVVRAALVAGGLPQTRVDIRPLGVTSAGLDVVDIMPPGVPRP